MATAAEISTVRDNVNEPNDATFSDEVIEALIDAGGTDSASAALWRKKAAAFAELVDVSEAGSSRKMSDLYKNALAMASHFDAQAGTEPVPGPGPIGHAKVGRIERLT